MTLRNVTIAREEFGDVQIILNIGLGLCINQQTYMHVALTFLQSIGLVLDHSKFGCR